MDEFWTELKESELWAYTVEEFKSLPVKEKIRLYCKVFYPERDADNLTFQEKLDVIVQHGDMVELLRPHLTDQQIHILKLMDARFGYKGICEELGYKNKASVSVKVKEIRNVIYGLLEYNMESEEELENKIIELTNGGQDADRKTDGRGNQGRKGSRGKAVTKDTRR